MGRGGGGFFFPLTGLPTWPSILISESVAYESGSISIDVYVMLVFLSFVCMASCSALIAINRRYFDDGRCQGHVDFIEFGSHVLQVSASIACIQHCHVRMTSSM